MRIPVPYLSLEKPSTALVCIWPTAIVPGGEGVARAG
jgi:hypothetical protein